MKWLGEVVNQRVAVFNALRGSVAGMSVGCGRRKQSQTQAINQAASKFRNEVAVQFRDSMQAVGMIEVLGSIDK